MYIPITSPSNEPPASNAKSTKAKNERKNFIFIVLFI